MKSSFTRTARTAAYALLLLSSLAWGSDRKADRLLAQSQKLGAIEAQLNEQDHQALDRLMGELDQVLSRYQGAASGVQLVCVSNGQVGNGERFTPTAPATGVAVGKPTMQATCQQLISVQNQGMLCLSNGEFGNHERFGIFDTRRKQSKGGLTDLKNCQMLVTSAHGSFVCHSNGEFGNHERFVLFNRDTDKALGGLTTLEQCTTSIPR